MSSTRSSRVQKPIITTSTTYIICISGGTVPSFDSVLKLLPQSEVKNFLVFGQPPTMNTPRPPSEDEGRTSLPAQKLLQYSRETRELGSLQSNYASSLATKPAPVAKSWAHFVAGG